jgi:site-specific recombinase XerD
MPAADSPDPVPVPARVAPGGGLADVSQREAEAAVAYALDALAPATRRAYRHDYRRFEAWCRGRGLTVMSAEPETVAAFLASEAAAGLKPATIARRTAAIRYAHGLEQQEPPTSTQRVRATMAGIRRRHGTAPAPKTAATAPRIAAMVALAAPDTLGGLRDRALLLLGFAGAFRSELVALQVADLAPAADGLRITIRRSKTDQEGQGQDVAIPHGARLRPVEAVRAWLEAAGIERGPVFRCINKGGRVSAEGLTAEAVGMVVKDYTERAGFRPEAFAGHSLRAGFLTSGAEAGASVFKLMEVSRHKSMDTLRGYVRRAELFKDHAGSGFL